MAQCDRKKRDSYAGAILAFIVTSSRVFSFRLRDVGDGYIHILLIS